MTTNLSNVTLTSGDKLTLNAVATGATSWKFTKDGRDLAGATGSGTTATFTVPSVTSNDAGTYQVTFSNSGGSTKTIAATVVVS